MEIEFPKWKESFVYADTETYVLMPEDIEIWNIKGTPGYTKKIMECIQVPGLLVWESRAFRKNPKDKFPHEYGDGFCMYTVDSQNYHEKFLIDMGNIYAQKHIPVIHFHNAKFDVTALAWLGKKLDPDLILYTYNMVENKNMLSGAMYSPKYKFKAKIVDTLLYDRTLSVAKMGESLNLPKIEGVPYAMGNIRVDGSRDLILYIDLNDGQIKSYSLSKYIDYAIRDVSITRRYDQRRIQIKEQIGRVVVNDDEVGEKVKDNIWDKTQAGHSRSLLNIYLKRNGYGGINDSFRIEIDKKTYDKIRNSNMGGFTTFNKYVQRYICSDDEIIRGYDANSLYPHCMSQELPGGRLLESPPAGKYVEWWCIYCYECKGVGSMEFINTRAISTEKLSIKDGTRKTPIYVPSGYIQWLENNECHIDYEIAEIRYQKTTDIVKGYMDDLYSRRIIYKKERDKYPKGSYEYCKFDIDQEGIKTMMNSVYGKFCERVYTQSSFYYSQFLEYRDYHIESTKYRSILTGSYITYKGRISVLEKIRACVLKGGTVLYCDTDSVMYVSKKTDNPEEVFGKDTGWKGEGKEEGKFTIFLNNLVKKKYCLLNYKHQNGGKYKLAMSGTTREFKSAICDGLDNDTDKTVSDLLYMFDPNNSVVIKDGKKNQVKNRIYGQILLYSSDFKLNPSKKKVDAYVYLENGTYRIEKNAKR